MAVLHDARQAHVRCRYRTAQAAPPRWRERAANAPALRRRSLRKYAPPAQPAAPAVDRRSPRAQRRSHASARACPLPATRRTPGRRFRESASSARRSPANREHVRASAAEVVSRDSGRLRRQCGSGVVAGVGDQQAQRGHASTHGTKCIERELSPLLGEEKNTSVSGSTAESSGTSESSTGL